MGEICDGIVDKENNTTRYITGNLRGNITFTKTAGDKSQKLSKEKDQLGAAMMNMQRELDKMTDELNRESVEVQDSGNQDLLEKKRVELRQKLNEIERGLIISEGRVVVEKEKLANQLISYDLETLQFVR